MKPTNLMTVVVNDLPTDVPNGSSIAALLETLALRGGPVAVELNCEIVPGERFGSTTLQEHDRLEIVSLTGGG